ncbi:MAG TPA: hypothetical protein VFT22_21560 [Kofleriaceae bacterium]|nr:hypothetical protein [Kofleriaceae bacterium]
MRDHVSRSWKLVIAVAAGLATCSFFEPFYDMGFQGSRVSVSAYRILFGFDEVGQVDPALRALPAHAQRTLLADLNQAIRHDLAGPRPNLLPFHYLSALLMLLIAAVALVRRQLGLFGALFAIAAGLCAIGGWIRMLVLERQTACLDDVFAHPAGGAALLAVAGALALIAGVGAGLWGDPGGLRARRVIVALLPGGASIALELPTRDQDVRVPTATLRRGAAPRRPG